MGLHRELELLVEAGLTPTEALAAATSVPARSFDLTDRGRIPPACEQTYCWSPTIPPPTSLPPARSAGSSGGAGMHVDRGAARHNT